jgi:hypothetical protein
MEGGKRDETFCSANTHINCILKQFKKFQVPLPKMITYTRRDPKKGKKKH